MSIEVHVPDCWADSTIEYFADSLYMLGVDIDPHKGVRYSGFWSQGDGASFKGIVNFSNSNIGQFEERYPTNEAMMELAKEWEKLAAELQEVELKLGYNCHRYCHDNTMTVGEWYAEDDHWPKVEELEGEVVSILRGFAKQLYKQLHDDYDYQLAYETATLYEEFAAESREITSKLKGLDSITDVPALVALHVEELQANRQERLEVLESKMGQLEDQFHYRVDVKSMTIHEFLAYINLEF